MKKGFPVRLLALLLCCFCLLSAIPTQALATDEVTPPAQEEVTPAPAGNEGADASKDLTTEDAPKTEESKTETPKTEEPKTEESKTETPKTEEPTLSLYDRLMACQSVEEINAILDNLSEEEDAELEAFTEEQNAALSAHMEALGGYGTSVMTDYFVSAKKGGTVTLEVDKLYVSSNAMEPIKIVSANANISATYTSGTTNDAVTIIVGSEVDAGDYMVYVQTASLNWSNMQWEYETKHSIRVTVSADGTSADEDRMPNTALKYYNGGNTVTYDVVNAGQAMDDASHTYIASVTLNDIAVIQDDADDHYGIQAYTYSSCTTGGGWYRRPDESKTISRFNETSPNYTWKNYGYYTQTGQPLSTYYTSGSSSYEESVSLKITPASGYYVTRVYITCSNGKLPLKCEVLRKNKAYDEPFTLETGREVSVQLSNKWFGHYSESKSQPENSNYMSLSGFYQYFLLIEVARIPTPTFVEYDYGDIVTHGGSTSIFDGADAWVTGSTNNNYGATAAPDTDFTQFRYTYGETPGLSGSWKHYANSVTSDAKANAASVGYYFAGWKAVYYTECVDSDEGAKTGNTKLYTFSNPQYDGREYDYEEGDEVPLYTHVKLTAQWEPIQVKVTKQVVGLADAGYSTESKSYTLKLQKVSGDGTVEDVKEVTIAITGDGKTSYVFGGEDTNPVVITPGTYKVVEIGDYTINGTDTNAVCTTTYASQTVAVAADGTVKELKVINTYSSQPATQMLTVVKNITGNMHDPTKTFTFKITTSKPITYNGTTGNEFTFTLGKGDSQVFTIPVGTTVTVTEDPGTYTPSYTGVNGDTVNTENPRAYGTTFVMPEKDCTVTFTNDKTVQIETAVNMDFAPYVLLLTVAAFGALLLLRKRRVV